MNSQELRAARESLRMTAAELAAVLEVDKSSVHRWERDQSMGSYRPPPARAVRLLKAYLAGYRPDDWPTRLRDIENRLKEIEAVRE